MNEKYETANASQVQPLLVNEREAAMLLGVSPRTVWTLADAGELPVIRIGRRKFYRRQSIEQFIIGRETRSSGGSSKCSPQS